MHTQPVYPASKHFASVLQWSPWREHCRPAVSLPRIHRSMDRQRYRLMVRLASAEESSRSGFSLSIIRKAETLYNSCADAVWYVRPDASSAGIHHRTHEIKGRTAAGREVIMADQPSAEQKSRRHIHVTTRRISIRVSEKTTSIP